MAKAINRISIGEGPELSELERKSLQFLIIDADTYDKRNIKISLNDLGFIQLCDAADHLSGLDKIRERAITHVLFQARPTNISAKEFLLRALELDEHLICLPTSYQPTVDDVFALLIHGARGFIAKPYNQETLDEAITMASKGEPLSEAILYAKDRNEALASFVFQSLDKVAHTARQSRSFETAKRELPQEEMQFKRACRIARTFFESSEDALLEAIVSAAIGRASGPASSLGRFRQRMQKRKSLLAQRLREAETERLRQTEDAAAAAVLPEEPAAGQPNADLAAAKTRLRALQKG